MCTKSFIADEEHDDQNRKGGYHAGDKDGVHLRNQPRANAGIIDDILMRSIQISKTTHDVIPQGRGRINKDHAEEQSKSWPYGHNEKSYDLEEKSLRRAGNTSCQN